MTLAAIIACGAICDNKGMHASQPVFLAGSVPPPQQELPSLPRLPCRQRRGAEGCFNWAVELAVITIGWFTHRSACRTALGPLQASVLQSYAHPTMSRVMEHGKSLHTARNVGAGFAVWGQACRAPPRGARPQGFHWKMPAISQAGRCCMLQGRCIRRGGYTGQEQWPGCCLGGGEGRRGSNRGPLLTPGPVFLEHGGPIPGPDASHATVRNLKMPWPRSERRPAPTISSK
jgi:hypothetical protein